MQLLSGWEFILKIKSFLLIYERPTFHNIPGSEWAWGLGTNYNHVLPYYRLSEFGRSYEGPHSFAFLEHKDVVGLTVKLQVFNMMNSRAIFFRKVYGGLRDRSPVLFNEDSNLSVQPIFILHVTGSF